MKLVPFKTREEVTRAADTVLRLVSRAIESGGCSDADKATLQTAGSQLQGALLSFGSTLPTRPQGSGGPQSTHASNVDKKGFDQFADDRLVEMIGRYDVHSVDQAMIKSAALPRLLTTEGKHQRLVYRGQMDSSWDVVSRLGRTLATDPQWLPPNTVLNDQGTTSGPLPVEVTALDQFRTAWPTLPDVDPIDHDQALPDDSPEWWFRMQHYDTGDATRLLDVTSSPLMALLFACVDWATGKVDTQTDGIVYCWAEGDGANVDDFLTDVLPATAHALFANKATGSRLVLNPPLNERSKAQSGGFLWWPECWKPCPTRLYYFLIPVEAKPRIARELLAVGVGPKEAVRGRKGLDNEENLRSVLDLPSWKAI